MGSGEPVAESREASPPNRSPAIVPSAELGASGLPCAMRPMKWSVVAMGVSGSSAAATSSGGASFLKRKVDVMVLGIDAMEEYVDAMPCDTVFPISCALSYSA